MDGCSTDFSGVHGVTMAVAFNDHIKRTSEYTALPEHIEVLPELNGRHELPDITALVDSILRHGQLQPVTIRKTGKNPVLVAGFSRWRAISYINANKLTPAPLELSCSYTQLTEKQAFLANIEENRVRNETSPIDDAYNVQRLINVYQMSEQEVATAYRVSVSWVKDRLQLLELTPEAEVAVRSGRVKPSAAKAISKLSQEQQRKVLEKKGTIEHKDVKPAKSKPVSRDLALLRLIAAVFEDVVIGADGPAGNADGYVEIDVKLISALWNYIEAQKA
jgi:ParB/RepB/Spo0J family partition protein